MAVTVDVYGSCVSRDLFYYTGIGKYELRRCIVHTPLSSLYEKPIHLDEQALAVTGFSKGDKILLQIQTERIAPGLLKRNKSDYLVIDLADEVMNLREVTIKADGENAAAMTYLAQQAGHDEDYKKLFEGCAGYEPGKLVSPLTMDIAGIERKFKKFVRQILFSEENKNGYKAEEIIIIEAYYAGDAVNKDSNLIPFKASYKVKENNEYLKKLYPILEACIPGCTVIKFPQFVHAAVWHKNGLSPINYTSDVYKYFESCLDAAVNYSRVNTIGNLWLEQSVKAKYKTRLIHAAAIYDHSNKIAQLQKQISELEARIKELEGK